MIKRSTTTQNSFIFASLNLFLFLFASELTYAGNFTHKLDLLSKVVPQKHVALQTQIASFLKLAQSPTVKLTRVQRSYARRGIESMAKSSIQSTLTSYGVQQGTSFWQKRVMSALNERISPAVRCGGCTGNCMGPCSPSKLEETLQMVVQSIPKDQTELAEEVKSTLNNYKSAQDYLNADELTPPIAAEVSTYVEIAQLEELSQHIKSYSETFSEDWAEDWSKEALKVLSEI